MSRKGLRHHAAGAYNHMITQRHTGKDDGIGTQPAKGPDPDGRCWHPAGKSVQIVVGADYFDSWGEDGFLADFDAIGRLDIAAATYGKIGARTGMNLYLLWVHHPGSIMHRPQAVTVDAQQPLENEIGKIGRAGRPQPLKAPVKPANANPFGK